MSEEGDKTCPLCAEEMDTTDQQLKPCKCGYEICVWCWHQIMDMAEKDGTEGRCPACRTPYDKEKIVGTAPSCGRLPLESTGKKKSHKGKNKTSEGRKQLASVRVIQRNLVYVVGLPISFADEDLLQRKEYFGRYGKVLKASISRTATGAIQHFPNSACSVYITYSKEDEAIRCIQTVHGFVLDGRPLRACFGTTKYCHAWLRNLLCNNPDCLYLHEVGSQEDSFTKDEIISAYTRVQQITGSSNGTQRRSGNVLPPPTDEYSSNIAAPGKPVTKSYVNTNHSAINSGVFPPNSSSGRSSALPAGASWGTRGSSNQPVLGSAQSSEPDKQKLDSSNGGSSQMSFLHFDTGKKLVHDEERAASKDKSKTGTLEPCKNESDDRRYKVSESSLDSAHSGTLPVNTQVYCQNSTLLPPKSENIVDSSVRSNGPVTCSTAAVGTNQFSSLHNDPGKNLVLDEDFTVSQDKRNNETLVPWGKESDAEAGNNISESSLESAHSVTSPLNSKALGQPATELPPTTNVVDNSFTPNGIPLADESVPTSDGNIEDICSDILSMGINVNKTENGGGSQHPRETMTPLTCGTTESVEVGLSDALPSCSLRIPSELTQVDFPEMEDDLFSFEKQRINDPEYNVIRKPDFPLVSQSHTNFGSPHFNNAESCVDSSRQDLERIGNLVNTTSNSSIGYPQTAHEIAEVNSVEYSNLIEGKGKRLLPGRYVGEMASGAIDTGESSIISNILSMDFGSSDEPLTYAQNLAKLLGEIGRRQAPPGVSGPLKVHNSNQSRFSFAREDMSQESSHVSSVGCLEQGLKQQLLGDDFSNRNVFQLEKIVNYNSFPVNHGAESNSFTGSHFHLSSNRPSGSRSQVSAPPGFSVPSKAPPPGFASHDTRQQSLDPVSGNHGLDTFFRNQYQPSSGGNNTASNGGDIELIDPAILAVGKGVVPGGFSSPGLDFRSNHSSQLNMYEGARFQSFLQGSLPQHPNQRFTGHGDAYSSLGDPYSIPSRVMEQTLTNGFSSFSQFSQPQSRSGITYNGSWDGWNEIRSGNNLGMAELIRSEKLGFNNKFYGGYEDSKFRMPSSGNLYDGTYGI